MGSIDAKQDANGLDHHLDRKVQFDLGELKIPEFRGVRLTGEFPMIRARCRRSIVTEDDITYLGKSLDKWVKEYFDTTKDAHLFEGMAVTASVLVLCLYPSFPVRSRQMKFALKMCYWSWVIDNILEVVIEQKLITAAKLEEGTTLLLRLLQNVNQPFQQVEGFTTLKSLFFSLKDLMLASAAGNDETTTKWHSVYFSMERYFNSMRWHFISPVDAAWPEVSFRNWSNLLAIFDVGAAMFWIADTDASVPEEIFNYPTFRRILDVLNAVTGLTNDLLGMKKELEKNEVDNIMVYKVLMQKIPLEEAIKQVSELIKAELDDYLLLRNSILCKFQNHETLVKFIDAVESIMEGNVLYFSESVRHGSVGQVKFIN